MAKRVGKDSIQVRGFFRVNLVEHKDNGQPHIVGDSGWMENMVVATGKLQYLAMALGSVAGSKFISRMALGTGSEPATNSTALLGELADSTAGSRNRPAVTANTFITSVTAGVSFLATWLSVQSFATTTHNISNIAVINDTTTAGTIFAGNTFASSVLATNQDVQATYVINLV